MQNVYLEKWKRIVEERPHGYSFERDSLVKKYSWAIPDTQALDTIVSLGKPIIEMGAGTGYWARLLHDKGADIIAYDINPPRQESNRYGHKKQYIHVYKGEPKILINYSHCALFLCWPPYDTDMAEVCLNNWNGSHLIYIGERSGGCNGNDTFFNKIEEEFNVLYEYEIPQWPGLHDELMIFQRR
jgi:hypothetical protein